MNVLLHADGGEGIGLGHIARCGALASALIRSGHEPMLALEPALIAAGLPVHPDVPSVICGRDLDSVRDAVRRYRADLAVIDSYRWTSDELAALCGDVGTIAFDDEAKRALSVDAIINGAPVAEKLAYRARPDTQLWFGAPFQVVRDPFVDLPPRDIAAQVRSIIVLAGGTDPVRLAATLAAPLDACVSRWPEPCTVTLALGPFAALPEVRELRCTQVVQHPIDLAERMQQADLAITAAGQTLYELARCGTPAVAVCIGADQQYNLAAVAEAGAAVDAGYVQAGEPKGAWCSTVIGAVERLAADHEARRRMSECGQRVIDGGGAVRLVTMMERLVVQRSRSGPGKDAGH